jgi:hypothetical protein
MSKYCFDSSLKLTDQNIEYLDKVNPIIDYYIKLDHKMTLRQLHYQTVIKGLFLNNDKAYKKISRELTKGRMAGYVDWDVIEDRLRQVQIPYIYDSVYDAIRDTALTYRIDRMQGQENYIEIWVEKDALSGVLNKITRPYHVPLMVNRGFSSTSAMYDSAKRFIKHIENGQNGVLLYIGDHDPSGLYMYEDIQKRLSEFGLTYMEYRRIALTLEQVEKYDLIPNDLKMSDKRASWYIDTTGCKNSFEVDALDPLILDQILEDEIKNFIDYNLYSQVCKREQHEKKKLREIAESYNHYSTTGAY